MKPAIAILILLFIICFHSYSQKINDPEEIFDEGRYFFNRKDYEEAAYYFKLLVDKKPNNAHFNYRLGECFLNIPGQEHKAIPYLEVASGNIVSKKRYDKDSNTETKAPLHAIYYLGNAYRMNNQLADALSAYNKFTNSIYYWGNYNDEIVINEIKSCERAKIIQDAPVSIVEEILNESINTNAIETNPVVSGNDSSLIFIRKLKFYDAIFYCVRKNGSWSEPVNINPQLGSDGEFYPSALSYEGKEMYLIKKLENECDIYYSRLNGNKWSKVRKLNHNINSAKDETFASISQDGKNLYFSSNKRGSRKTDIFLTEKNNDGKWSKPKKMKKVINTLEDETNPCITNNGNTLFFCSKGHYNMGGYDIFYSNKVKGKWSEPINIGYPINTTRDDLFYYPVKAGKIIYISRSEENDDFNIYRIIVNSNLVHLNSTK